VPVNVTLTDRDFAALFSSAEGGVATHHVMRLGAIRGREFWGVEGSETPLELVLFFAGRRIGTSLEFSANENHRPTTRAFRFSAEWVGRSGPPGRHQSVCFSGPAPPDPDRMAPPSPAPQSPPLIIKFGGANFLVREQTGFFYPPRISIRNVGAFIFYFFCGIREPTPNSPQQNAS